MKKSVYCMRLKEGSDLSDLKLSELYFKKSDSIVNWKPEEWVNINNKKCKCENIEIVEYTQNIYVRCKDCGSIVLSKKKNIIQYDRGGNFKLK